MENITIGLPRALMYARYGILWRAFFRELGMQTLISEPSSRATLERGSALSVDETCLASKLFMGHVDALVGRCDYILVPRIATFGHRARMCARFQGLPDVTRVTFRNSPQKFLTYEVDVNRRKTEEDAFIHLGAQLGKSAKDSRRAYRRARKLQARRDAHEVRAQEALYKGEGLKILVCGHGYVLDDAYIGEPVLKGLMRLGATPIRGDKVERDAALRHSDELSPTCKWQTNRELVGSIAMNRGRVDGIVLLSVFPCGPDAMVNDLMLRQLHDMPVLNLVLDDQSGIAGVETRLESFIDIIRFKEGAL